MGRLEDPLTATLYADRQVYELQSSMPDLEVGKDVAPVRAFGPTMIAPRLADPEGSLQRTIEIQHRSMKDK
eukprot:10273915-Alexandrium_andersonii.AAC.1